MYKSGIRKNISPKTKSWKVIHTLYLQKLQLFTEFVLMASDIIHYMYSREQ
jgi:hypothetical protein